MSPLVLAPAIVFIVFIFFFVVVFVVFFVVFLVFLSISIYVFLPFCRFAFLPFCLFVPIQQFSILPHISPHILPQILPQTTTTIATPPHNVFCAQAQANVLRGLLQSWPRMTDYPDSENCPSPLFGISRCSGLVVVRD